MNDMDAVVTGATGFIGRYLVKELLQAGYNVTAVVRDDKGIIPTDGLTVIRSALEDLSAKDLPGKYDVLFHLGWHGVNREEIDSDPVHEASYNISLRCLEIARQIGCRAFCDSGSRSEYGQTGRMSEDAECTPADAYGRWKLRFYEHAYDLCERASMEYLHYRIFSVTGVGDHEWSLVSTACRRFLDDQRMEFGPCLQLWNYMAAEDAVKAMRMAYERIGTIKGNRILNIASRDTRILRDFIEEIYHITNSRSELFFRPLGDSPLYHVEPDIRKLIELVGWKDEIPFREQIRRIIEDIRGISRP